MVAGVAPSTIAAITEEPARYGFHATLKAPFRLERSATGQDLLDAVERFAGTRRPVAVPEMTVNTIGNFVALAPAPPPPGLPELAAACVEVFDPFRAPMEQAELDRRRRAPLTPREDELLRRWGYPYVMDAFRFHMTLTGPLAEPDRAGIRQALAALFEPLTARPVVIDALTVFDQPQPGAPFRIAARFPFAGGA